MVFTTHIFVFYFLPLVLAVYYALPWLLRGRGGKEETLSQARNLWLLAMSYVFYGWWNPRFILLMFFVTVVNYGCGHLIARAECHPAGTPAVARRGRGQQPGHTRFLQVLHVRPVQCARHSGLVWRRAVVRVVHRACRWGSPSTRSRPSVIAWMSIAGMHHRHGRSPISPVSSPSSRS